MNLPFNSSPNDYLRGDDEGKECLTMNDINIEHLFGEGILIYTGTIILIDLASTSFIRTRMTYFYL